MVFQLGNEFWKSRTKRGPNFIFKKPENLWSVACEYFSWCVADPIIEDKFVKGDIIPVPRMRPFTQKGLISYMGVAKRTWELYCEREEYKDVCDEIRSIIFQQKFNGAVIGIFQHNIIARELGLSEHLETENTQKGAPLPVDVDTYKEALKQMMDEDDC